MIAQSKNILKAGDHIARVVDYKREKYDGPDLNNQMSHHGIIISVDPIKVVHFNTTDNSWDKRKASVLVTDFELFRTDKRYIFLIDHSTEQLEVDETLGLCNKFSSEGYFPYHFIKNNCEHFVFHCKTGKIMSKQIQSFVNKRTATTGFLRGIYKFIPIDCNL